MKALLLKTIRCYHVNGDQCVKGLVKLFFGFCFPICGDHRVKAQVRGIIGKKEKKLEKITIKSKKKLINHNQVLKNH